MLSSLSLLYSKNNAKLNSIKVIKYGKMSIIVALYSQCVRENDTSGNFSW